MKLQANHRRLGLPLLFLLAGCGGSGDAVKVRIVTGLENKKPFHNLMQKFAPNALTVLGPNTCKQKGIVAAVAPLGDKSLTETFPVDVTTNYFNAAYTIDSSWAGSNLEFAPISVPVPRGVPVEVGIFGSLVSAEAKSADGSCRDWLAGGPVGTTSVIGHKIINVSAEADIPLRVWMNPALSNVQPLPTAAPPGSPECYDPAAGNQSCPLLDFYALHCPGCNASGLIARVEYGFARNAPETIVQWLNSGEIVSGEVNLPAIRPMKITFHDPAAPTTPVASYLADRASMSQHSQGVLGGYFTDPSNSNVKFYVYERPRSSTPTIGAFTTLAVGGVAADSGILKWIGGENAAFLELWSGTWGMGNLAYHSEFMPTPAHVSLGHTATNSPSGDFELVLKARSPNVPSVNHVASASIRYIPLGIFAAATSALSSVDGSGNITASVTFTSPQGTAHEPSSVTYTGKSIDSSGGEHACTPQAGPASSINCPLPSSGTYRFQLKAVNSYGGLTVSPVSGPFNL